MFTRKYVFETKKTRTKRIFKSSLLIFIVGLTAFSLLAIYIPIFAKEQKRIADEAFFQRSPDVIAVFTGDVGRIDYALKKGEKSPSTKIFISGVYVKNSLKTLLNKQGKFISVDEYLNQESHHVEIDYLARNTVENGLTTLRYLKTLDVHKNVLIISSDYHIFRISKIMNSLKDENSDYNFYFDSIPSNYTKIANLKKLIKEVYKFFKTSVFLMFWDRSIPD